MFRQISSRIRLPRNSRDLLHAANLRHGTDGFTSPPKEGVLRIFSPLKIRRLRPGLNPWTWAPKASTLPLDHRSRWTALTAFNKRFKICNCCITMWFPYFLHLQWRQTAQGLFQNLLCLKTEVFLSPYVILHHHCHICLSDCSIMHLYCKHMKILVISMLCICCMYLPFLFA